MLPLPPNTSLHSPAFQAVYASMIESLRINARCDTRHVHYIVRIESEGACEGHYITERVNPDGTLLYMEIDTERGVELSRRTTSDLDWLLYWLIDDAANRIAIAYQSQNPHPTHDPRRTIYTHWLALLAAINPAWRARTLSRLRQQLPFNDNLSPLFIT